MRRPSSARCPLFSNNPCKLQELSPKLQSAPSSGDIFFIISVAWETISGFLEICSMASEKLQRQCSSPPPLSLNPFASPHFSLSRTGPARHSGRPHSESWLKVRTRWTRWSLTRSGEKRPLCLLALLRLLGCLLWLPLRPSAGPRRWPPKTHLSKLPKARP